MKAPKRQPEVTRRFENEHTLGDIPLYQQDYNYLSWGEPSAMCGGNARRIIGAKQAL